MNDEIKPDETLIEKTIIALRANNIEAELVKTKEQALNRLKELIPAGAEIMTGSSMTLNQIGFTDLLVSGNHPWKNLKDEIVNEKDPKKQTLLRKQSVLAEYFLGSVQAVTENGETLIASASGSQLPAYAFTSPNVIWVVSVKKIVPDLETGLKRINDHVFPLEDARMKSAGASGSVIGRILIFKKEIMTDRKVRLIFVNENLGF